MAGRDLMACAQTGSGKTAAFCFPIISGILKYCNVGLGSSVNHSGVVSPVALILSPTRELSCQVGNVVCICVCICVYVMCCGVFDFIFCVCCGEDS